MSKWVVVREHVIEIDGNKYVGYVVIPEMPLFDEVEHAYEAIAALNLPLGWVTMTLGQLIEDLKE